MPKKQVQKSILSHLFIIFATGCAFLKGTEKAFRNRESIQKEI